MNHQPHDALNVDLDAMNDFEKGRRYMSEGLTREAVHAFDLAIDMNIECAQAFFNRGVCHYRLGNYRQAEIDLGAAALLGCEDAFLWSKFEQKRMTGTYPATKD